MLVETILVCLIGYYAKNKKTAFGLGIIVGLIWGLVSITIAIIREGLYPSYDDYIAPSVLIVIIAGSLILGLTALFFKYLILRGFDRRMAERLKKLFNKKDIKL